MFYILGYILGPYGQCIPSQTPPPPPTPSPRPYCASGQRVGPNGECIDVTPPPPPPPPTCRPGQKLGPYGGKYIIITNYILVANYYCFL